MSQSRLKVVADALTSIEGLEVFHYWRFNKVPPYCIWQEDGHSDFYADDMTAEVGWTGTVDYFTKTEFDENADAIESALNDVDTLSWTLDSVQYEEETNLIHHSWRWEMY